MIHEILAVGPLQCNCSILGDEQTGEAIVVDPGDNIEDILAIVERHGLRVKLIVITHAHIDHIGGAAKIKQRTGAPVYMNENDVWLYEQIDWQARWLGIATPEQTPIDHPLREGDKLLLGLTEILAIHTPGHTQGSSCLWIPTENKLIAGDTLFLESIGRTDLPGGDHKTILRSIHAKLFPLPDDTKVTTGHGGATTIGHEKRRNPFLKGL
jgi:hydroxyacylglutathione hydrolase